jgi:hypothetical protein
VELRKAYDSIVARVLQTTSGMKLKEDFNEKALQQKYGLFRAVIR